MRNEVYPAKVERELNKGVAPRVFIRCQGTSIDLSDDDARKLAHDILAILPTKPGGLAQLGEHLACIQKVAGSIPVSSTNPKGASDKCSRCGSQLNCMALGGPSICLDCLTEKERMEMLDANVSAFKEPGFSKKKSK